MAAAILATRLVACMPGNSTTRIALRCMSMNEVTVTLSSDVPASTSKPFFIHSSNDSMKLVERLILRTSNLMDPHAVNVVAFSGGVDSSLVADLVFRAFANYNHCQRKRKEKKEKGSVQAVLGISPAVPKSQIIMARTVAEKIGIPLNEVSTTEGSDETYQKNE